MFLLDEPTTGLHFADIERLIEVMRSLISQGHSFIVIEHNEQLISQADYVIDLGPGAAEAGGQIVAVGTPEEIISDAVSLTGRHLARR